MKTFPIIDLHCDLLLYLAGGGPRSAYDLASRCAIPHLRQGEVQVQTMAIFTRTQKDSVQEAMAQVSYYKKLPQLYPNDFIQYSPQVTDAIATLWAFENASGFCEEEESLTAGLKRLEGVIAFIGAPLYISFTWNEENRFGGGAWSKIGLKEDGKRLLDWLHSRKIAIDLSHASDALAYDILDYIEGAGLDLPLMASHSNSRAITPVPRNLPDELAKELFRRGALVGLALCRSFIGLAKEDLLKHIAHWIELGGEKSISLGADFFCEGDLPSHLLSSPQPFFPEYQNAGCYGCLLAFIQKELRTGHDTIENFAHRNARRFLSM